MRALYILAATLSLAGCRDLGLDGNIPVDQATERALPYQIYDTGMPGTNVVAFDDRTWIRSAAEEAIPTGVMVSVGTASGLPLYAPSWARPPYTRLYTPSAHSRWNPLVTVP